jgi:putative membrane-bound dehydrogenase-like protein
MIRTVCFSLIALLVAFTPLEAQVPTAADPRLVIELVAREPEIVTPTALTVDEKGRIWVIENQTHERPADYRGPKTDRIRVYSDLDATGHARRVETFAEGFRDSMGIALGDDNSVYLATRSDIHLLRDRQDTGKADERRTLVRLITSGRYPHNGLSGLTFDAHGNLIFALGENLGASYKLVGSDGTTLQGGGEGGNIYRCRRDGSGLNRLATGFWNTFALTYDGFGRLFAVDNDPDSRGPCRLLHIVEGGDYGYRFRNGRKGLHPFTAWNGELPGTLPMMAGTSEAPSGIVAYESNGLPAEYRGDLLTTSWGDHVIERFKLAPRGASFTSQAEVVVRGGEDFRPVGIAIGPEGALYVSDWVDKSYPVHGKGRIWRIRSKEPVTRPLLASAVKHLPVEELRSLLGHPRREIRTAAASALTSSGSEGKRVLVDALNGGPSIRARLHALWELTRSAPAERDAAFKVALNDETPEVRSEAAHLFGDLSLAARNPQLNASVLDMALRDPSLSVRMQALLAFRADPMPAAIGPLTADPDPFVAGAAITALARQPRPALLFAAARNPSPKVRVGVLVAMRRTESPGYREALPRFLADPDSGVRRAAIQWVGEERIDALAPTLSEAAATSPVTREVFEALLAAKDFLSGAKRGPNDEPSGEQFVAKMVADQSQPAVFRALALRMLRPEHPALTLSRLREFLQAKNDDLRREAMRALTMRSDGAAQALLRDLASDRALEPAFRADAVAGLAVSANAELKTRDLLKSLLTEPGLERESLRSLRGVMKDGEVRTALRQWWQTRSTDKTPGDDDLRELAAQILLGLRALPEGEEREWRTELQRFAGPRPNGVPQWQELSTQGGDAKLGERLFFHSLGPRCYACHRIDGRGAAIGPDLSEIGRSLSRGKLVESVLLPNKEIAPQFQSWVIATRNGKVRTGIIVEEGPNSTITVADANGKLEVIYRLDMEERHASSQSIMPEHLTDLMTPTEFRDLIEFLSRRR